MVVKRKCKQRTMEELVGKWRLIQKSKWCNSKTKLPLHYVKTRNSCRQNLGKVDQTKVKSHISRKW